MCVYNSFTERVLHMSHANVPRVQRGRNSTQIMNVYECGWYIYLMR